MVLVGKPVFALFSFSIWNTEYSVCLLLLKYLSSVYMCGFIYEYNISLFEPGALDFLEKPTVVFVRLKEAAVLDSALEAPVPVRFVFVLVGPSKTDMDYHETGRAMAALMADKVSEQ